MKDEALSPAAFMMENLHIALGSPAQATAIRDAVVPLLEIAAKYLEFQGEFLSAASDRFGLTGADGRLVAWLPLPPDTFSSRLLKMAS